MADDLAVLRGRALEHQRALTAPSLLSVANLAARWQLSPTTVRDIPAAELPYLEFGSGLRYRRRRYRTEDVAAYEAAHRRGARGAA